MGGHFDDRFGEGCGRDKGARVDCGGRHSLSQGGREGAVVAGHRLREVRDELGKHIVSRRRTCGGMYQIQLLPKNDDS